MEVLSIIILSIFCISFLLIIIDKNKVIRKLQTEIKGDYIAVFYEYFMDSGRFDSIAYKNIDYDTAYEKASSEAYSRKGSFNYCRFTLIKVEAENDK